MENYRNQNGIGEKEVLVVSFGTSFQSNREKTIGAMEEAFETAFPGYSVRRAFTSKMILRVLEKRDGIQIDDVPAAMQRAVDNGVKELIVQPTHLMNGLEYTKLLKEMEGYRESFPVLKVGQPLLMEDSDFREMISAVAEDTKEFCDGKTAICLMGHGSEAEANAVYSKMQSMMADIGYADYYVGTVEAKPDLADVVSLVKQKNYSRVVLQPLMIVAGDHANNDMAGDDADSWKSVFEAEGYEVRCVLKGLGELPEIAHLAISHARKAIERNGGV